MSSYRRRVVLLAMRARLTVAARSARSDATTWRPWTLAESEAPHLR